MRGSELYLLVKSNQEGERSFSSQLCLSGQFKPKFDPKDYPSSHSRLRHCFDFRERHKPRVRPQPKGLGRARQRKQPVKR